MSNDENDEIRGAALARMFSKWAQPTPEDHAKAMDMSIRAMARDAYNPNRLNAPQTVRVANAPVVVGMDEPKRGSGWQEEKPLEPVVKPGSMEERVMSQMIDQALPPGAEKKDRK
jgi:hypothetical protein